MVEVSKPHTSRSAALSRSTLALICASLLAISTGCTPEPGGASDADAAPSVNDAADATRGPDTAEYPTLTLGVVPQQAASSLAKQWMPLLAHVGREAGVTLTFKTASDIPTFEERCAEGDYDIAYMNPYHYTVFHDLAGYEPIAKRAGSKIKGILVKKRGADLQRLEDLEGAALAFPAPRAFAATLLTGADLRKAGVTYEPHYVSSHDSVYLNVAKGRFAAGGGIIRTFKSIDAELRDQLEILWETPGYTPHAFAIHPRVAPETRAAVTKALLELSADEVGRKLLEPLKIQELEAALDQDWDDVRELEIEAP